MVEEKSTASRMQEQPKPVSYLKIIYLLFFSTELFPINNLLIMIITIINIV